jgi:V8-like Glu-specific endopeptidase
VCELFDRDLESPEAETFSCRVVPDKQNYFADITILDCSESAFRATDWLQLEQVMLSRDVKVDVIGYPGEYTSSYLKVTQGVRIGMSELADVTELLPKCELTVSHGPITRGGKMPTYRLSTIGGMSGAPVILNGKAVGTPITFLL